MIPTVTDRFPIPPIRRHNGRATTYGNSSRFPCYRYQWLKELAIGEHFDLPNNSARKMLEAAAWCLGVPITTQKLDGNGYRVWRIAPRQH